MDDILDYKELMSRAKNGDGLAFGQIYEEMYTPVYRYIYGRTKNKDLTDDFVQTVFLKVYESLHRLEPNNTPLRLLFTVARNTLIDYWRKKKEKIIDGEEFDFFDNIPDNRPDQKAECVEKELRADVQKYLSLLEEEYREVILLKYFGGLPAKEISLIMDLTEDAVRQRQSRALKKLRIIIEEYED